MATIKEATESAIRFAREALGPERTEGVRLEEVESSSAQGQEAWLITLSMFAGPESESAGIPGAAFASLLKPKHREYKTFSVLKQSGEVTAMKMRQLTDA